MGYFEKKFHSFYGVRWGRGAERWRHLAISPCPGRGRAWPNAAAPRRGVQSGVVSAMMLSCGRIPAAFRSSAGSAIKPRPETEMVACI